MKLIALLLLTTLATPAAPTIDDGPGPFDYVLLGASYALITVDAWQSMDGYGKHADVHENNPLIVALFGRHPRPGVFVGLGAAAIAVDTIVWKFAPEPYRWILPTAIIIGEVLATIHNSELGLTMHF